MTYECISRRDLVHTAGRRDYSYRVDLSRLVMRISRHHQIRARYCTMPDTVDWHTKRNTKRAAVPQHMTRAGELETLSVWYYTCAGTSLLYAARKTAITPFCLLIFRRAFPRSTLFLLCESRHTLYSKVLHTYHAREPSVKRFDSPLMVRLSELISHPFHLRHESNLIKYFAMN